MSFDIGILFDDTRLLHLWTKAYLINIKYTTPHQSRLKRSFKEGLLLTRTFILKLFSNFDFAGSYKNVAFFASTTVGLEII